MGRWLTAARSLSSEAEKTPSRAICEPTKPTKPGSVSSVSSDFVHMGEISAAAHERAGKAAGRVPAVYLDAWATFQCAPSRLAAADTWQQAIEDAGLLLDRWGDRLAEFQWPAESIFGGDGLAWFARGEAIEALGPEHAVTLTGRLFDRIGGDSHA